MQEKTPPGVSRRASEGETVLQEVPPRASRDLQRDPELPRELPWRSPKGPSKSSIIPRDPRRSAKVRKQSHRRPQGLAQDPDLFSFAPT